MKQKQVFGSSILVLGTLLLAILGVVIYYLIQFHNNNLIQQAHIKSLGILDKIDNNLLEVYEFNNKCVDEQKLDYLTIYETKVDELKRSELKFSQMPIAQLNDTLNKQLQTLIRQYSQEQEAIINKLAFGKIEEAQAIEKKSNSDQIIFNSFDRIYSRFNDEIRKLQQAQLAQNDESAKKLFVFLIILISIILVYTFYGKKIINIKIKEDELIKLHLQRAEKTANENALLKEQFLSNMSHEIRTPLNGIIGFVQQLKKTKLDSSQNEISFYIEQACKNLLSIVNDILDFSKLKSGALPLHNETFSLTFLIDSIIQFHKQKAEEKGILFSVIYENALPEYIHGDSQRVTQIINNLLNNALKFTDKGSIQFMINNRVISDNEIVLNIEVHDTGIGIPENQLELIFNRFHQAEVTTSKIYGGTGLGLSIVKQIVEMMGGVISVKSNLHQGTVFRIELPFKIVHTAHPNNIYFAEKNLNENRILNMNILVVEDNTTNMQLLKYILGAWKMQFDFAEDGKEAIQILKQKNYDAILMDIQMPILNGFDTTLYLRNELKLSTPIIAMTAYVLAGEKEKCLSVGMNDYITKPIDEESLFQILKKYKERKIEKATDLTYLRQMLKNDNQAMQEVIGNYIREIDEIVSKLGIAFQKHDCKALSFLAHRMKSSITIFVRNDESILKTLDNIETKQTAEINEITLINQFVKQSIQELKQEHN